MRVRCIALHVVRYSKLRNSLAYTTPSTKEQPPNGYFQLTYKADSDIHAVPYESIWSPLLHFIFLNKG